MLTDLLSYSNSVFFSHKFSKPSSETVFIINLVQTITRVRKSNSYSNVIKTNSLLNEERGPAIRVFHGTKGDISPQAMQFILNSLSANNVITTENRKKPRLIW